MARSHLGCWCGRSVSVTDRPQIISGIESVPGLGGTVAIGDFSVGMYKKCTDPAIAIAALILELWRGNGLRALPLTLGFAFDNELPCALVDYVNRPLRSKDLQQEVIRFLNDRKN